MKVVVTGGRNYWGRQNVFNALNEINHGNRITILAHGACTDRDTREFCGADRWANEWGVANAFRKVAIERFPADWSLGRKAGPIRNRQMLETVEPDLVVAFPGGAGTESCCGIAVEMGIRVKRIR